MLRKILLSVVALFTIAAAIGGYLYGPMLTGITTGKIRYLVKPSPERYAKDALAIVETLAINADSPEFAQAKDAALEAATTAKSFEDTYEPLRAALKAGGGKHSNFLAPGDNEPSTVDSAEMPAVEKRGELVYLKLPALSRGEAGQTYATILTDGIHEHARCGAIIDLRGNGGGDMGPMLGGLSPLLPNGTALEFVSRTATTQVTVEGNGVKGGGTPTTTHGGKQDVPTAVLTDADTASSGEATMLAFRGLPNSRSFGAPTAGYASANVVIDLYDGAGLMITTAKDRARTGEDFSDDPIQPDVTTEDPEADAAAWLRQQCTTSR
ncbi:S41 family peptidase [Corynebacterium hindlerae]|uniref:S41 family peptidase n=1 Tax=Corynebacterium hindlerae TaxID=699041 RepID=UPI001FCB05E6|nr:S41 family peptidase [Corynebacterium hindlerae]